MSHSLTITDYFNKYISKPSDDTQCWIWLGEVSERGYGRAFFRYQRYQAHRLSYILHVGAIADGLVICHKCDNRLCVNPNHLFIGTQQANCLDAVAKGRTLKGSSNGSARLNETQVREIKDSNLTSRQLAALYGVGKTTILRIKQGTHWTHV